MANVTPIPQGASVAHITRMVEESGMDPRDVFIEAYVHPHADEGEQAVEIILYVELDPA